MLIFKILLETQNSSLNFFLKYKHVSSRFWQLLCSCMENEDSVYLFKGGVKINVLAFSVHIRISKLQMVLL